MNQQLVTQMADDDGVIDVTEPSVGVDFDINIRQDDLRMFEAEDGRLLVRTSEMDAGVFIEPTPSPNGVVTELAVGVDTATLTEIEPAQPDQPEVEDAHTELVTRVD